MRADDYLSSVGIIKRRTVAKEMASNGLIEINGHKIKPAHQVHINDIIRIKGNKPAAFEILEIPAGSVPKDKREKYFKTLSLEMFN